MVDTKLVGDISVQRTVLLALEHGCGVLVPVGDRLPYDLVLDVGRLVKIQVKTAYVDTRYDGAYVVNARRAKTNRKTYRHELYKPGDFDFLLAWLKDRPVFYAIPASVFMTYKSAAILETKRSRATPFRNIWPW
jgi:hypothetical protein